MISYISFFRDILKQNGADLASIKPVSTSRPCALTSEMTYGPLNCGNLNRQDTNFLQQEQQISTQGETLEPQEEDKVEKEEAEVEDETIYFKSRAKLFIKKSGEWETEGAGDVTIRQKKDNSSSRICIANNIGKMILNAKVYQGLSLEVRKKDITTILFREEAELVSGQGSEEQHQINTKVIALVVKKKGSVGRNVLIRIVFPSLFWCTFWFRW